MNSLSNEFPTTTVQSANDCFRLERTINKFRRLSLRSTQFLSSVEDFEPTYSSIDSLNTNEDDDALNEPHDDAITDDDEDNLFCEMNLHADHYRLCKARATHDAVLENIDVSLTKKTLTANEVPNLDTKTLIAKIDDVAKTIDLDVSKIPPEQIKDPVLGKVRSLIREGTSPEPESSANQQSKGLLRYCQEFDRLRMKKKDNIYATLNLPIYYTIEFYEFIYFYHSS